MAEMNDRPDADNVEATYKNPVLDPEHHSTVTNACVERGWSVFPCHSVVLGKCTCPAGPACESPGKHPRVKNGVNQATNDPAVIAGWIGRWGTEGINWAVACGPASGWLLVVDIDTRKNGFTSWEAWCDQRPETVPNTLKALTGGGGQHLFFTANDPRLGNRVGWLPGVDIKAHGGYVMLPPGAHISGGTYSWKNDLPIAAAPAFLVEAILEKSATAQDFLPETDDILRGVPEGQRDDTLFRACCRWRRQLKDSRSAVEILALTAARACLPPFPDDQAIKCVDSAFKQDHSDQFLDLDSSRLVEWLGERLQGEFCYVTQEKSWRHYKAGIWELFDHSRLVEKVRIEMLERYHLEVGLGPNEKRLKALAVLLADGRIKAVSDLLRGRLAKDLTTFDVHLDRLCVGNGVIDQRTGELGPHDPSLLFTTKTDIDYVPGATSEVWTKALEAIADPVTRDWLQVRLGQASTGYSTDDDSVLVFYAPTGYNGKTTIITALDRALGGYALLLDTKVLKGEPANEETLQLRGARFVYVEELPDMVLNMERLRQLAGSFRLTARPLYGKPVNWVPTHSLFLTTNYDLGIEDTKESTWRRLWRVVFPFTYLDAGHPRFHTMENVKLREPDVRDRIENDPRVHEAILAWLVEGSVRYFRDGLGEMPAQVRKDTAEWQLEADYVQQFFDAHMEFKPGVAVSSAVLLEQFKGFLFTVNVPTKGWTSKRLMTEIRDHKFPGVRPARARNQTISHPYNYALKQPVHETFEPRMVTTVEGLAFKEVEPLAASPSDIASMFNL